MAEFTVSAGIAATTPLADETDRMTVPVTVLERAVIVTVPGATPVATPLTLSIVATAAFADDQRIVAPTMLLSASLAVAVRAVDRPV